MNWLALPLFFVGVVIFCQLFDLIVGGLLARVIILVLGDEEKLVRTEPSKTAGRAVWLLFFVSFVIRSLPVGAAIAIGQRLRPDRWFAVWLIAGVLAAQPRASAPHSTKEILGIWVGRLMAAGAVVFGALVPEAMPDFIWWIARKLVL